MKSEMKVPDGGWGWFVVLGAAFINISNQSLMSIFGLLLGPKIENFSGVEGVATVMSISVCLLNFSGFTIAPMGKIMSTRTMCQVGILMVSMGMLISGYASNYLTIIFGYGIFTGVGLGIISSSTFLIINSYFIRNKSLAVGIAMAGTSIGQIFLPIVIGYFKDIVGIDHTIYILSFTSFCGIFGTFFFYPLEKSHKFDHTITLNRNNRNLYGIESYKEQLQYLQNPLFFDINNSNDLTSPETSTELLSLDDDNVNIHLVNNSSENMHPTYNIDDFKKWERELMSKLEKLKAQQDEEEQKMRNKNSILEEQQETNFAGDNYEIVEYCMVGEANYVVEVEKINVTSLSNIKNSIWWYINEIRNSIDVSLMKNIKFVHSIIGLSLIFTTNISFSTFFPLFMQNEMKLIQMDVSRGLSLLSLMDLVGRLTLPFIMKKLKINPRNAFLIGIFALTILRSVTMIQTTFNGILLCAALAGFARSIPVVNQNIIVADMCGNKVPMGVEIFMIFKGIFILIIGALIGCIRFYYAISYGMLIHLLDVISSLIFITWTTQSMVDYCILITQQ